MGLLQVCGSPKFDLFMKKLENIIVKTLQAMIACLLGFMIIINVVQMVTRYFIALQIMWVEDYSVMCLYWIFALGTPMVWILGQHMDMDILAKVIKGKFKTVLYYVMQFCAFLAGIGLAYTGYRACKLNHGFVMSIAGFDEVWRYIPVVVGGAFLSLASVFCTVRAILQKVNPETVEEPDEVSVEELAVEAEGEAK